MRNLAQIEDQVKEAAKSECNIIIFPELATVGYGEPEANAASAETIPGQTSIALSRMAKENKIAIAIGMPELDAVSNIRYNTMLLIGSDGEEVFRYHKVHLWTREKNWAQPGENFPVKEWENIPTGMWVCYDGAQPRNHLLLMSCMPLFTLSLLPLLILLFLPTSPWNHLFRFLALLHIAMCTGDLQTFIRVIRQIPAHAVLQNKGWQTYWRV